MAATKGCSKCGEVKSLTEFGKHKNSQDGHRADCKTCQSAYARSQRAANPEKARKYNRHYYASIDKEELEAKRRNAAISMNGQRQCTKCGETKTIEEFNKKKLSKDGYSRTCRTCCKIYKRARYAANPRKVLETNKRSVQKHPEKERERQRRYYQVHPEKAREYGKRYRSKYPDKERERSRRKKRYPERDRERSRLYAKTHATERLEYKRRYRLEHPEKHKLYNARRRAREQKAPGNYTIENIEAQLVAQGNLCFWCSEVLQATWDLDHVVALSRGGPNSADNLVCACRRCNRSKNDRIPFVEWEPLAPLKVADEIAVLVKWMEEKHDSPTNE